MLHPIYEPSMLQVNDKSRARSNLESLFVSRPAMGCSSHPYDPNGIPEGPKEPAHRIPMGSVEGTQGTHGEFSVEVSSEFSGANMTGVNFRVNFFLMV